MHVSIILATYQRPETLRAILSSFCRLECSGIEWEVVVVDNAGGHEAKHIVEQFSTHLPVTLVVETYLGKTNALNTAMGKAQGELIVFTDDDVMVDQKWIMESWSGAQRWPQHSVFGGRIVPIFPEGTDFSNLQVDLDHVLAKGCFSIADWKREEGEYHPGMVYGPNWAMRSDLFRKGYTFRTDLGPGTELTVGDETELCYRLYRDGFIPIYLPRSMVSHHIREEQLVPQWVYRRVYNHGRQWALNEGSLDFPLFLGVPRFLYKTICQYYTKYLMSYFHGTYKTRFHWGLRYWFEKGVFHQYWKGLL